MDKYTIPVIAVVFGLYVFILLGPTGLLTYIGAVLLFIVPTYLLLGLLPFSVTERLIFSFFTGIGIYSSLVYYFGLLFSSVRIGMAVSWVLLVAVWFVLWKTTKKEKTDEKAEKKVEEKN